MECCKPCKNGNKCTAKAKYINENNEYTCKSHANEQSVKIELKENDYSKIMDELYPDDIVKQLDIENISLDIKDYNIDNLYSSVCLEQAIPQLFVPIVEIDSKKIFKKSNKYFIAARYNAEEVSIIGNLQSILDLIIAMHNNRLSCGNFKNNSFKKFDNKIKLSNANSLMKCLNLYGETLDSRNLDICDKISLHFASRTVMMKKSPNRIDDFESLLYLIINEKQILLPWQTLTKAKNVIEMKEKFISNPEDYIDNPNIIAICKYINDFFPTDRPNYTKLKNMFMSLL